MPRSWIRTHNIVKRSIFLICYAKQNPSKYHCRYLQANSETYKETQKPQTTHINNPEGRTNMEDVTSRLCSYSNETALSWWRTDGWTHKIHVRVQQLSHMCDHLNFSKDDKVIQWRKNVFQIRGKTAKHACGKNVPWTSLYTINKCYFKNWYIT